MGGSSRGMTPVILEHSAIPDETATSYIEENQSRRGMTEAQAQGTFAPFCKQSGQV